MTQNIPNKESLTAEFKSCSKSSPLKDSSVVDAVVGMSNADGGCIFIGVEDDGTPSGIPDNNQAYDKWLDPSKAISYILNNTSPAVLISAEMLDGPVMAISVPKSSTIVATKKGSVLKRTLKTDKTPENRALLPAEYTSHLSALSRLDFTATLIPNPDRSCLNQINRLKLRELIKTSNGEQNLLDLDDDELDLALGIVKKDSSGNILPTVCGLLLIGDEDHLRDLVPTHGFTFQVLDGTSVLVNKTIHLPIVKAIDEIRINFEAFNKENEYEEGLLRVRVPEFASEAFREALINAIAHRDYSRLGEIFVRITEEELEIINPGGFINGISPSTLLTAAPYGRNPLLADVLKRIGLAERSGRGVDRIFAGSIQFGRNWPDYTQSTDEIVKLIIPRDKPDFTFRKILSEYYDKTGQDAKLLTMMILSLLLEYRSLFLQDLMDKTMHPSNKVKKELERLIELGFVERLGSRKHEYILSQEIYSRKNNSDAYKRRVKNNEKELKDKILTLVKQNDSISRSEVSELVGLSESASSKLLKDLVLEGKLVTEGTRRWTRYRSSEKH